MERKRILIEFGKTGAAVVNVEGAKGEECLGMTSGLEERLGGVTAGAREMKPGLLDNIERERPEQERQR